MPRCTNWIKQPEIVSVANCTPWNNNKNKNKKKSEVEVEEVVVVEEEKRKDQPQKWVTSVIGSKLAGKSVQLFWQFRARNELDSIFQKLRDDFYLFCETPRRYFGLFQSLKQSVKRIQPSFNH